MYIFYSKPKCTFYIDKFMNTDFFLNLGKEMKSKFITIIRKR